MLDTTLATTFIPGTNLKGKVAGANWLFLLPNLHLMRVVCMGLPQQTTLPMLSAFSQELIIVATSPQQAKVASQHSAGAKVQVLALGTEQQLLLPDHSVDLLLLADQPMVRALGQNPALYTKMQQLLTPEGLLYYEYTGALDPLDDAQLTAMQRFWLTPLSGEMHTAVPVRDGATIGYFRAQGIYTPSINRQSIKYAWQGLRQSQRPANALPSTTGAKPITKDKHLPKPPTTEEMTEGMPAKRRPDRPFRKVIKRAKSNVHTLTKRLGTQFLQTAGTAEEFLSRDQMLGSRLQRRGVLRSKANGTAADQLPAYVQTLAQADGLTLADFGWGLAARGDYSSRKLLFFLFKREQSGGAKAKPATTPTYVVKMVRDPIFNARLENEVSALRALYAHGVGDRETLPQVVFAGHHAGLAIVGESAVDGVPFRQRTQLSADCPYANAATTWFTELAVATATPLAATPVQVAATLQLLLTQFAVIYQLSPTHLAFLTKQLATLQRSQAPFPLVFQHGDPGTWNLLVTPSGRVAVLDWEAAEAQGMPLWDLFYFLRSYAVGVAQHQGVHNSLQGFTQQLLTPTALRRRVADVTHTYAERIGLASDTIAPLFYTCWVHRALKEATRLTPAQLENGHYVNLLRLCIDQETAVRQLWQR